MWGVATSAVVPEATAASAMARASGMFAGPSSSPGSTWQCRSITPATNLYCGASLVGPVALALPAVASICCPSGGRDTGRGAAGAGLAACRRAQIEPGARLVSDVARDCERGGCGRRGCVAHVQRALGGGEQEVVQQAAVASERLRANACGSRLNVA